MIRWLISLGILFLCGCALRPPATEKVVATPATQVADKTFTDWQAAHLAASEAEAAKSATAPVLRARADALKAQQDAADARARTLRAEDDARQAHQARLAAEQTEREAQSRLERRMIYIGAALFTMAAIALAVGLWLKLGLLVMAAAAGSAGAAALLVLGYAGHVMQWAAPAMLLIVGVLGVWRLIAAIRRVSALAETATDFMGVAGTVDQQMKEAKNRVAKSREAGIIAAVRGKPTKVLVA